ncbi:MAG: HAMP domain-containing protein [Clostridia bacterium]|nr:HAMP domain-containing protein [Clostridia bacterium]
MFKSIFGKYLAAFTVILLCCIVVIILSVAFVTSNDARSDRADVMASAANNVRYAAETVSDVNGSPDIAKAFSDAPKLAELVNKNAQSSHVDIYVFDGTGNLVAASAGAEETAAPALPESALNKMLSASGAYSASTVEDLFEGSRLNQYTVGNIGGERFIVLVSVDMVNRSIFGKQMVMVAVTVSLWVFLAAMISLYVISRRITKPLSEVVSAATDYSKGRFDRKIEVSGKDEVAELAKAINEMASSLAHIEEVRNSFIGNVSHDLRTPMTTIQGFVDGILDGTIPPEKHEYYLNIISEEVRRLSRLVNTLLEMSRLESGANMHMTDFNLTEKARTVLISLESKITKKDLDIEFDGGDEDVFVRADADLIHRVMFNLTDNAVKFTPNGGKITVRIAAVSDGRRKKCAKFSIRNTGVGIPKEELPHVFERFYKTDRSRGLDKSGTGLGLYIAKAAILNHGSDLTVDSVQGEYTEFSFTLPLGQVTKNS